MTSHVESKTFFYGKGDWLEGVGAGEGVVGEGLSEGGQKAYTFYTFSPVR